MLKKLVEDWADKKAFLPNEITEAFQEFKDETQIEISRTHFFRIFSQYTKIQVIKTGGVFARSIDVIETIVKRSYYGVKMWNTYSIDEKPIIISNYKSTKVRVTSPHKGKVPANKIKNFKKLDNLSNLYLICCITFNGVLLYHLSESPLNTVSFNAFLHKLCTIIQPKNYLQYLLLDNASFHFIEDINIENMKEKKIAITKTPPLGCLFNPIEEFFAFFDKILKRKIKSYLNQNNYQINQEKFIDLIHSSIKEAINMDLKQIFRRAGILE